MRPHSALSGLSVNYLEHVLLRSSPGVFSLSLHRFPKLPRRHRSQKVVRPNPPPPALSPQVCCCSVGQDASSPGHPVRPPPHSISLKLSSRSVSSTANAPEPTTAVRIPLLSAEDVSSKGVHSTPHTLYTLFSTKRFALLRVFSCSVVVENEIVVTVRVVVPHFSPRGLARNFGGANTDIVHEPFPGFFRSLGIKKRVV